MVGGDGDGCAAACIGYGIVGEVAEDAVEEGEVAAEDELLGELVADGHVFGCHFLLCLVDDLLDEGVEVDDVEGVGVGGIVEAVEGGDVVEQGGESL